MSETTQSPAETDATPRDAASRLRRAELELCQLQLRLYTHLIALAAISACMESVHKGLIDPRGEQFGAVLRRLDEYLAGNLPEVNGQRWPSGYENREGEA